jgi:hypothetical protein
VSERASEFFLQPLQVTSRRELPVERFQYCSIIVVSGALLHFKCFECSWWISASWKYRSVRVWNDPSSRVVFSLLFGGLVVYRSRAPSLEKKEMIMDQSFSKHVQLKRAPSALLCCNNMQLVVLVLLASLAAHFRYPVVEAQVPVSFTQNYLSSTDPNHIRILNAGGSVDLVLDQYSGRQL